MCKTYDKSQGGDTRELQSRMVPPQKTGSSHLKTKAYGLVTLSTGIILRGHVTTWTIKSRMLKSPIIWNLLQLVTATHVRPGRSLMRWRVANLKKLEFEDKKLTNPTEIAEGFNKFFAEIGAKLSENIWRHWYLFRWICKSIYLVELKFSTNKSISGFVSLT